MRGIRRALRVKMKWIMYLHGLCLVVPSVGTAVTGFFIAFFAKKRQKNLVSIFQYVIQWHYMELGLANSDF